MWIRRKMRIGVLLFRVRDIAWSWKKYIHKFKTRIEFYLLSTNEHSVKGSPENPSGQAHIGLWLTTSQVARNPQDPGHGSTHFWLLHAWFRGHSALSTHSGRHAGGEPKNDGKQEHTAWLLISRHWLLGPHIAVVQGCSNIETKKYDCNMNT